MNRGRLVRYSPWQFRDFAIDRGIAIVIIGLLWGYVLIAPMRLSMGRAFSLDPSSPTWVLLLQVAAAVVTLSVLIALNGIVSNDRNLGYYRFLFAKPVSPAAYYGQLFVVYLVGVVASMLLLCGVLHMFAPRFNILHFLIYTALIYVAMGGIGFFISVATRYDWVILATVWLGSRVLRDLYGGKPGWRSKAVQLLPPLHRVNDVASSLITNGTATASDVWWLLGYGATFFVLGLLLLRWRSLAD